jgi:hypothetical protein
MPTRWKPLDVELCVSAKDAKKTFLLDQRRVQKQRSFDSSAKLATEKRLFFFEEKVN